MTLGNNVDAIICLGNILTSQNTLDLIGMQRVREAVSTAKSKKCPIILLSGGIPSSKDVLNRSLLTQAKVMYHYASNLPHSKQFTYLTEETSQTTIQKLYYCLTMFMLPRHWQNVILVCDEFEAPVVEFLFSKMSPPNIKVDYKSAPVNLTGEFRNILKTSYQNKLAVLKQEIQRYPAGSYEKINQLNTDV